MHNNYKTKNTYFGMLSMMSRNILNWFIFCTKLSYGKNKKDKEDNETERLLITLMTIR